MIEKKNLMDLECGFQRPISTANLFICAGAI
jgi:hypothetical protein